MKQICGIEKTLSLGRRMRWLGIGMLFLLCPLDSFEKSRTAPMGTITLFEQRPMGAIPAEPMHFLKVQDGKGCTWNPF